MRKTFYAIITQKITQARNSLRKKLRKRVIHYAKLRKKCLRNFVRKILGCAPHHAGAAGAPLACCGAIEMLKSFGRSPDAAPR
jgi:hypothetical protein